MFSDHDNDFKALNSQLLKEVVELDWTASHGRRLGGQSVAPQRSGGGGGGGYYMQQQQASWVTEMLDILRS